MNPEKWTISKIYSYLVNRQGFRVIEQKPNLIIMHDAFGYQYEITVKTTGRVNDKDYNEDLILAKEQK